MVLLHGDATRRDKDTKDICFLDVLPHAGAQVTIIRHLLHLRGSMQDHPAQICRMIARI